MKNAIDKVGCSTLSKAALTAVILASMTMGANAADTTYQLDEVVVTATKTENTIKDVPEATEVITQKDFKALGAQDLQSALKLANNVDVGEAGMTGNKIQIRGMTSGHTLLLIDGKRMAGEDADTTVNAFELSRVNLSNVDRIEIVRGVSSALYGSDAMGGVINIITKKPQEAGLTVGANTGSREMNNYYHYDFGQIGKFNGSIDANFQKVRKFSWWNDAKTTFYGPRQNFSFDGEYALSEKRGLGMNLTWMKDHMRSEDIGPIPQAGSGFKVSNYDNERKGVSFDYHAQTNASDFMVRAYYNQLDKNQDFFGEGKQYNFDKMKFDTFVLEARDTTKLNDEHRLTIGGEYRNLEYRGTRLGDNGNNAGNVTVSGITKAQSEEEINFQSAYVQDEWTPNDKLIVIPSIRYDHSDKFGSNVSPKIGVTYKVKDNLRFKANYGRGYRAPTLSELYMSMDGSFMSGMPMWVYGNPNLNPEKTLGYDFSVEGEHGKAFAKVTYFHNKVNDLITSEWMNPPAPGQRPTFPLIYQYQNVNSATLEGVETEIGYQFNSNWTVKGTWNYLDSIDNKDGSRIVGNGRNYGTLQLQYDDNKENGISGVFWYQFMSDYYLGASSSTGNGIYSYHTWNFSINKRWNNHLSTFLGIDNILNDAVPDVAIAGRTWRTGVEWKF